MYEVNFILGHPVLSLKEKDNAMAFDKCETGVLLHRLKECGVREKMGHWLAASLTPQ